MKSHLTLKNLSYMGRIIRDMLGTRCIRDMLGTRCIRRMFGIPYVRREEVWSMTMGILAALPVPQMAILVFFPTLRASRAVNRMRIMNSLILLQYVPRIYPIYRHCKDLNKNKLDNCISDQIERKTWVPGLLNFILYILASYVFGTFWYFFSIQRQVECWGHACQSGNGCEFRIFDCDDDVTLRNVTLLNDLCPINPSNAKVFDFGIYLDALQSGMLGSTDFPRKVLQCFSWGVRNLSSFGSNLRTSMNAWETLFVVSICISGLLLFIYLLGHLQTFMQATNKEYWIRRKMWKIDSDIIRMSDEYGLSNNTEDIHKIVRRQLRREEDLDVENIFSILPFYVQNIIKRHLLLPKLKKVPTLQGIDENVLADIFLDHLEQVIYDGGNYIIREGEPLDMMIFISRGSVLTYNTSSTGHVGGGSGLSNTIGRLTGGDFYGQELISWATTSTSFSDLPISSKTLKSLEKVEVFAIRASVLLHIVSKHKEYFKTETQHPHPTDSNLIEINEHGNLKLLHMQYCARSGTHLLASYL
ncbi:hypothetical protein PRUPE_6G254400 [Prunus persica]|uniref:Cyclic nucleotide-binding domain-containing protein n=1 Tax=Prunus persica TaxID=3760 RepID=A0A251NVR7_PRUPE|nr:cyclic nucleotide-gated ion channel 1-like isoform X2 [Prunus persica]ONI03389.1 hypothetical protein PRUPE_6G254400 [Prunus persica]